MTLADIPAAIIAGSEKHLAEAELRMFEDGLDVDEIVCWIAEMREQNRRVAEQVRDALPRLRHALETRDHFEPGELQALVFGDGKAHNNGP